MKGLIFLLMVFVCLAAVIIRVDVAGEEENLVAMHRSSSSQYNPDCLLSSCHDRMMDDVSDLERKGLRWAGIALIGVLGFMALTLVPDWGVLRNPDNGDRFDSPVFDGVVVWILIFFVALGDASE